MSTKDTTSPQAIVGRPTDEPNIQNEAPEAGAFAVPTMQTLLTQAREWGAARAAFLALTPASPDVSTALDRLADAEDKLFRTVRGHV